MTPTQVGRLLRTLVHLRTRQAAAQLAHALHPRVKPVELSGVAPRVCVARASIPFLPGPRHARSDGLGRVELLNRTVDFAGAFDWDHRAEGPLWAYHLHEFHYARDPALSSEVRSALMLDWIARHRTGVGWEPHPISLRILSWSKLLLTPSALALDAEARERVLRSLASQVETLSRNLEVRLQANHLLSNLIGVVFGGLLLEGSDADRWLAREPQLRAEADSQILPDGAHVERSPMYHSLLLENLLDLLNLSKAVPERAPLGLSAWLEQCTARMLGALRVWTHPDAEIALFGDAAFGVAHPPGPLEEYAARLGVRPLSPHPEGALSDAGFVRLAAGPFTLIASVAGPMPAHQPGHAHCDALSFELSVFDQRVVTDTGVTEYLPGPQRDLSRSVVSHATLQLAGAEQAEVWSAHRIGGRPDVALEALTPGQSAQARCASWSTRDSVHRRYFSVSESGLEICDRISGRRRPVRLSLPLAPGLEPEIEQGVARLRLRGGRLLAIQLPDPGETRWAVERAPYFPEFGRQLDRACLVGRAENLREGRWRFDLSG